MPGDSKLQTYTLNICLYTWKDMYDVSYIDGSYDLLMSEKILILLAKHPLGVGREMILDNWYTSVRLTKFLLSKGTCLIGTIRTNKKVPWDHPRLQLQPYQSCFVWNGKMFIIWYRNKRDVYILFTKHIASINEKSQNEKWGNAVFFKKPGVIDHYNKYMGAKDVVNQGLASHDCCQKKLKDVSITFQLNYVFCYVYSILFWKLTLYSFYFLF